MPQRDVAGRPPSHKGEVQPRAPDGLIRDLYPVLADPCRRQVQCQETCDNYVDTKQALEHTDLSGLEAVYLADLSGGQLQQFPTKDSSRMLADE